MENGREHMDSVVSTSLHPLHSIAQLLIRLLIFISANYRVGVCSDRLTKQTTPEKAVPVTPFRVLDAPHLKDDYYCTVLAYSHSHRTLAVAL